MRLVTCSPEGPLQRSQAKAAVQLISLSRSLPMDFSVFAVHLILSLQPLRKMIFYVLLSFGGVCGGGIRAH